MTPVQGLPTRPAERYVTQRELADRSWPRLSSGPRKSVDHWKGAYENYRDDAEESIAEAEAAARDMAMTLRVLSTPPGVVSSCVVAFAADALARHPSFSGEEGTEG